jgi:hypothetical protein
MTLYIHECAKCSHIWGSRGVDGRCSECGTRNLRVCCTDNTTARSIAAECRIPIWIAARALSRVTRNEQRSRDHMSSVLRRCDQCGSMGAVPFIGKKKQFLCEECLYKR